MYRKILMILVVLGLIILSGCDPVSVGNHPLPPYKKGNHPSFILYDLYGNMIGSDCFEEGSVSVKTSLINNFNDNIDMNDLLELLNYKYKIRYNPHNFYLPYPHPHMYEYYVEQGLSSMIKFDATFSYVFKKISNEELKNLNFFDIEYTPHNKSDDSWNDYRLDSYITYMDIDSVEEYVKVECINNEFPKNSIDTIVSFNVCIELEEFHYLSKYDMRENNSSDMDENERNEILIIKVEYLLEGKIPQGETVKKILSELLGYRCSVFVPKGIFKDVNGEYLIRLDSLHNKKIKILKNDTFE